jgi:hypothetical protein
MNMSPSHFPIREVLEPLAEKGQGLDSPGLSLGYAQQVPVVSNVLSKFLLVKDWPSQPSHSSITSIFTSVSQDPQAQGHKSSTAPADGHFLSVLQWPGGPEPPWAIPVPQGLSKLLLGASPQNSVGEPNPYFSLCLFSSDPGCLFPLSFCGWPGQGPHTEGACRDWEVAAGTPSWGGHGPEHPLLGKLS